MKPRYYALIAIAAAVGAGTVLFVTAQRVQMADANLRHLQAETMREKQALHVLHAEWDYLNRPDRLEALAKTNLNMVPPQVPAKPEAGSQKSENKKAGTAAVSPLPAAPTPQNERTHSTADAGIAAAPPNPAVQHSFQTMLDSLNKDAPAAGTASKATP